MSASPNDPHDLERFVSAQHGEYTAALTEISNGAKQSHWMWFIFPQIAGLGFSAMSRRFAIASLDEARAYLEHPLLGLRLRACVDALQGVTGKTAQDVTGKTAQDVFDEVDAAKLRSSLTLFAEAGTDQLFAAALGRWFGGVRDDATLALLGQGEVQR